MRPSEKDLMFYKEALKEAQIGLEEGGIPIGAVLVLEEQLLGRGHNKRLQRGSVIRHGEMDCLENAGRLGASVYQHCTLYTTLSPCDMCTGAILLYKIPRVVIGENMNFKGAEDLLKSRGVELIILQDAETIDLMKNFIEDHPTVWNEDIGEVAS